MDMEKILDGAMVRVIKLAEDTHAELSKYPDGSPEKMGDVPHQPGQFDGGELRKTATARITGTRSCLRVTASRGSWRVEVLDLNGIVLYACGPGEFDLATAAAAIPPRESDG